MTQFWELAKPRLIQQWVEVTLWVNLLAMCLLTHLALRGLAVVGLDSDQLKLMHLLTKWAEVTLLGLFLLELVCKGLGATVLSVTTVARRGMGNDESV